MRPPRPTALYSFFLSEATVVPSLKNLRIRATLPKLKISLSPSTRLPSLIRKRWFRTLEIQTHVVGHNGRYPGIS